MEIKAKFKGRDGSLGYRNGQTYLLEFKTVDDNNRAGSDQLIQAYRTDGKGVVLYSTMRNFLNNWQVIK